MSATTGPQMSSLCEGAPGPSDRELSVLCHQHCHGNVDVTTSFGDVALRLRCDCLCHIPLDSYQ